MEKTNITNACSRTRQSRAADAGRYVLVLNLLIVSIVLPFVNEWHSKDLEGDEIKSQGDSILRS